MKKYFVLAVLMTIGTLLFINSSSANEQSNMEKPGLVEKATYSAVETRCGWFSNPTPANAWLNDKDGEWIIGTQGGHQAEGDWPSFKKSQWIKTNGSYGYGCACLKGTFNKQTNEVVEIKSAAARALSVCRKDKALKKP